MGSLLVSLHVVWNSQNAHWSRNHCSIIWQPWPTHVTIVMKLYDVSPALLWTMRKQWDFSTDQCVEASPSSSQVPAGMAERSGNHPGQGDQPLMCTEPVRLGSNAFGEKWCMTDFSDIVQTVAPPDGHEPFLIHCRVFIELCGLVH